MIEISKINKTYVKEKIVFKPCLNVLDCAPVGGEEESSDDEANKVTDHNYDDNQIEIDEFRNGQE